MTGTTRSSADLDPRRRRILVRAWRRGIREMDLVIGGFAEAETPERFRTALIERMRAYVPDFEPQETGDPQDAGPEGQATKP
jgi:antitoxin CptB